METKRIWPGPNGPTKRCWLLLREVDPSWLDLLDTLPGFWSVYDEKNGPKFLAMVVARSGTAPLRLSNVRIDRMSEEANFMREFVTENTWRIEELSVRADEEWEIDGVMSRDFGILRSFGASHDSDDGDGWNARTGLILGPLEWLRERATCLKSLKLRRVLVPMDLVGRALNLRCLSLFGVNPIVTDDTNLRLDIAVLCRLGGLLSCLEELEIEGEVALDRVDRVKVVQLRELRRLQLWVAPDVLVALLGALVMPVLEMLEVRGEGMEDETVAALAAVRDVIDGLGGWTLGIGRMSLGETWTGQEVWLQVDYGGGRCKVRWRACGGFGLVKVASSLVSSLRVADLMSLDGSRWATTERATMEDWRSMWKETLTLDSVSIDYGGGGDVYWDNLADYLLTDTREQEEVRSGAWPELRTVRLSGMLSIRVLEKWLDWLRMRVEKGLVLEHVGISGRITASSEVPVPSWDIEDEAPWRQGEETPSVEEWITKFRTVAEDVKWSAVASGWGPSSLYNDYVTM